MVDVFVVLVAGAVAEGAEGAAVEPVAVGVEAVFDEIVGIGEFVARCEGGLYVIPGCRFDF
jgi:hypothetical protein